MGNGWDIEASWLHGQNATRDQPSCREEMNCGVFWFGEFESIEGCW
jgi:hypothetical protein